MPVEALLKWQYRPAVQRPLRYARRLASMSPGEIAARLAPARPGAPVRFPAREQTVPHFLFEPAEARRVLDVWCCSHPGRAARLVETARAGLDRWEVFGVPVALRPGAIDWQGGDVRWAWEINRHQFLFTFARAFALTGDPVYARRITDLLADWWDHNPFGRGVNWSSALEVAVRSISWLWTLPLLLDSTALDAAFLHRWLVSLEEHYKYISRHLSVYTDPTNHLIGEAAALWMLAVAMPHLPDAQARERRALEILSREIERQVAPDGVCREQSAGYQRFVLDFYLQVLALARRAGRELPPIIGERVRAMLEFLLALAGENGELPAIGDSDDARGIPFPELSVELYPPELAMWLDVPEAAAAGLRSRVFPHGGYCLFESQAQGRRVALLFDAGPLGLWPNASHGHADALSVQLNLDGRWILGDPGTGCYGASPGVRNALRGTAAHNTVAVDDLDQTDALDVFKWLRRFPVRLLDGYCGRDFGYALAMHEGYHRLQQPVTHYRAVLFVHRPNPSCIIADRLEGEGCHRCALRFHFPPGTILREEGPRVFGALDASGAALLRLTFSDSARCEQGLWSRRFGQWEQAPVLTIERTSEMPLAWLTFIDLAPHAVAGPDIAREGPAVTCRRGDEIISWTIEGGRHRFRYQRLGPAPASFER